MNHKYKISILILLIIISISMPALGDIVTSSIEWTKTFRLTYISQTHSVQQTLDEGYVLVGETAGNNPSLPYGWIIKTDNIGNEIWIKTYERIDSIRFSSIKQINDGYVVSGSAGPHALLLKTDINGNKEWERTYSPESGSYYAASLDTVNEGGYILAGDARLGSYGTKTYAYVVKTDINGNKLWDRTFKNPLGESHATSIIESSDGNYVFTGWTWAYGNGMYDAWLVKLDKNGNELWNRTFGGTKPDWGNSIQETHDGYVIVGATDSFSTYRNAWLIKVDKNGNEIWDKLLGDNIILYSVQQTVDGGFVTSGDKELVIRTDDNGNEIWRKDVGLSGSDIEITSEGGYIVVGGINIEMSYLTKLSVDIVNSPPIAEAGGPYTVNEGDSVTLDGSTSSDTDGDSLTYIWDLNNDGTYETPGMTTMITPPDGPKDIIVGLQVSDGKGGASTDTATITINNVNPVVGPITINPPNPIINTEIIATGSISDKGILDTHTATWNWGDGTTSQGTISNSIASGNHIYMTGGLYHTTLTVRDNDGGTGTNTQDIAIPCKCEKLSIKPAVQTHNEGKTIIVDIPNAIGTKNQTDQTSFDVTIGTDWIIEIMCTAGEGKCKGKYKPSVVSSSWDIDGKGGTIVSESHTGNGDITCESDCGTTTNKTITTTYKATIQKGNNAGKFGNVLKTVAGKITLKMDPEDCPGNSWTMTLNYKGDVKTDTDSIDYYNSDFDGDGNTNGAELKKGTDPLDPNSK